MTLAGALALRADAARRAERLRARIVASAQYQEGETPAEDADALLVEAGEVLGEMESLIRRINRTCAPHIENGTLTDARAGDSETGRCSAGSSIPRATPSRW